MAHYSLQIGRCRGIFVRLWPGSHPCVFGRVARCKALPRVSGGVRGLATSSAECRGSRPAKARFRSEAQWLGCAASFDRAKVTRTVRAPGRALYSSPLHPTTRRHDPAAQLENPRHMTNVKTLKTLAGKWSATLKSRAWRGALIAGLLGGICAIYARGPDHAGRLRRGASSAAGELRERIGGVS